MPILYYLLIWVVSSITLVALFDLIHPRGAWLTASMVLASLMVALVTRTVSTMRKNRKRGS